MIDLIIIKRNLPDGGLAGVEENVQAVTAPWGSYN